MPLEERKVEIFKWISVFPKNIKNKTADEYLLELSEKKTYIFNKFKRIIIEASIENQIYKQKRNIYDNYLKYKNKYIQLKNNK